MSDTGIFWIRDDFRIEIIQHYLLQLKTMTVLLPYLSIIIKILIIKQKLKNGGFQSH